MIADLSGGYTLPFAASIGLLMVGAAAGFFVRPDLLVNGSTLSEQKPGVAPLASV